MAIGTIAFPASMDDADTLIRSGEDVRTRLAQPVTATATTLPLESVARLLPAGQIRLEREYVTYAAISGNSLTGCVRGAFQADGGYPASEHGDGAEIVQASFVPAMHRVHSDAILALETDRLIVVSHSGTAVTASNSSTSTYQTFLTKSVVLPAGTYAIDMIFSAEFYNDTGGGGSTARIGAPTAGTAQSAAETTANSQFTIPGGHIITGHVSDGVASTTFRLEYRANVSGTANTRSAYFLALCRRTA